MRGKYGSGADLHATHTHTHTSMHAHTHTHLTGSLRTKSVVKSRLTVEFSGRMFQTADSLLMVLAS